MPAERKIQDYRSTYNDIRYRIRKEKASNYMGQSTLDCDELVFEVAKGELQTLRALVVEKMSNVVKLSVPLEVQVGTGRSWDEAGH